MFDSTYTYENFSEILWNKQKTYDVYPFVNQLTFSNILSHERNAIRRLECKKYSYNDVSDISTCHQHKLNTNVDVAKNNFGQVF